MVSMNALRVRRHALGVGNHRRDHHRCRALVAGPVAEQALHAAALKHRVFGLLRIERVEREAPVRFDGHHLVDAAAWNHADRHGIVEIDGPRVLRVDERVLEAGLREHQHLRIDADAELLEQARQVAGPFDVVQLHGAAGEPAPESPEGIGGGGVRGLRLYRNHRCHEQDRYGQPIAERLPGGHLLRNRATNVPVEVHVCRNARCSAVRGC